MQPPTPPAAAPKDRFSEIQRGLASLWDTLTSLNDEEQTIVVVPSLSVPVPAEIEPLIPTYEERMLFTLFLLRQPRAHVVFVSSRPVRPEIVDYYLSLVPGTIPSRARERLHMVTPDAGSVVPLTKKLLDRPDLLERIRALVRDPARAHIVPYTTTDLERELVVRLGIPMYASDPALAYLGTKTGSRRLFAESGVAYPAGSEGLHSLDEVTEAILELRARRGSEHVIVKLDEGISGLGNAVVDLRGLEPDAHGDAVLERLRRAELPGGRLEAFAEELARQGGVVEERVEGAEVRSPSVQLRVTPGGDLEVLSTHDQLLGGATGQVYEGCRFPADPAYARAITRAAADVGRRLAAEGVLGRFAIDFVMVRGAEGWEPYAIELNLRKGGTTHPFLTLQFLTDGRYDPDGAVFVTPSGTPKFFVASDHVEDEAFRGMAIETLFDIVVRHRLHFDHARQTGIVMHMLSGLERYGRLGMTVIAGSHAEADEMFARAQRAIAEDARSIR